MKQLIIKEIKVGEGEGGLACGPVGGPIVGAVRVNDGENDLWFYDIVVEGIDCICMSKEDQYDRIINNDLTEEECEQIELENYDGVDLFDEDLIQALLDVDEDKALIVKLVVYLTDCFLDEEEYDKNLIGKNVYDLRFNIVEDDFDCKVSLK